MSAGTCTCKCVVRMSVLVRVIVNMVKVLCTKMNTSAHDVYRCLLD